MSALTLAVLVGNRGFFPKHLCVSGRATMLDVLHQAHITTIIAGEDETNYGAIESHQEARLYGDLLKKHRDQIDGIIITLPNFGDERAIANAIRFSGLDVPILVHAYSDDADNMTIKDRRDSFCGKISVCNNLKQYGLKYTLTDLHTCDPTGPAFAADLARFRSICHVVKAMRGARFGAIGARPSAFNTVRYSEKLFERHGISIETLDLSELLGWANRLHDADQAVEAKLHDITTYTNTDAIPPDALLKMAKLGAAIDRWMRDQELSASAIQCWTALEEFYGVVPCTLMSMMSNTLKASACETDIAGTVSMYALQAASGQPAALLDWNNNYGTDPDKAVVFHCSNLPKDFFGNCCMDHHEIIAGTVGKENTYGTINGRIKNTPFTYLRVSTNDETGQIIAYTGQGQFTDDPLATFGGYGVVAIPRFQELLAYICENGFEHHTAATQANVAPATQEALTKYLNWPTHHHQ